MAIDYETIGRFACEKANDYQRSYSVHKELLEKRKLIDSMISDAEKRNDKAVLSALYKEFRVIRQDQTANQSYRQKFCEDFLSEIINLMKETDK